MFYRNKKKTKQYVEYQEELLSCVVLEEGDKHCWPFGTEPVEFHIEVGLSSKLADLDNVLKPLFDTYQTIYEEFNDKTVYKITASKELVGRGDEYLHIEVRPYSKETAGSEGERQT